MRFDLEIIASWISSRSRVLDCGCGDGELLAFLKQNKQVNATGIDRHEEKVKLCINKGLSVIQGDMNVEVIDYADDTFDYVILSQTLQQVYAPDTLLLELMRIGRHVIVSFPNFSHWAMRLKLLLSGRAPKSKQLPYEWYDTPNIRVITIKDFRDFARKVGFTILTEAAINTHHEDRKGQIISLLPNLRATYGILLIGRNGRTLNRDI